jgi:glutathione S-transferase
VYATGEDYGMQGIEPSDEPDGEIERVRRAHRNDLENILPFFGVGLLYSLSGPTMVGAQVSLIGFTVARVLHSIFYIRALQPHRTIAFAVGVVLMVWMTVASLFTFFF